MTTVGLAARICCLSCSNPASGGSNPARETPADRVAAPAQVAEDQVLVGIADRQQRLEVSIALVAFDQGVADQDDAVAVLQLERAADRFGLPVAQTNTTTRRCRRKKTLTERAPRHEEVTLLTLAC